MMIQSSQINPVRKPSGLSNGVNCFMEIGGLQKLTLIDYPGKIACTVFLAGCNFRCPWCYSRELVLPEEIKKQPKITENNFFKFLKSRKGLLEAVTICGGEPTIHRDLAEFCKKIKKLGFLVKLDTNGSSPKMLANLIGQKLVDYIAMDVKAPLSKIRMTKSKFQKKSKVQIPKYQKAAGVGVNLEDIKKSIEIIRKSGIDYEFRTTVVPALHLKKDILEIARLLGPAKKYYLQNFRPEKTVNPDFLKIKPYPEEYLLEIRDAIAFLFGTCQLR